MKKKSQMQMMQTIFVLLIFFILLVIGIVFFISSQKSNIKDKQREYSNLDLVKKSQLLNFLPELQCSFDNVINPDCYDIEKINAFIQIYNNNNKYYYNSLFGNLNISVSRFETSINDWNQSSEWNNVQGKVIYENVKQDFQEKRKVQLPVSLYDPIQDFYYFGMINLEIYR
jgi:hypothetical protein